MPKIELLYEGLPDLLPMDHRSKGIHVSQVVGDLCVELGHYEKSEGPPPKTRMNFGNAFEHAIVHRFDLDDPDRYTRIGELEKDGMFGTPDLFDLFELLVIEIKLTWMSTKWGPGSEKFWKYEVQMMAYCWMMEVLKSRLHVGFINGDYKWGTPGADPTYRVWQYNFTHNELAENWAMLKSHAKVMKRAGRLKL